MTRGLLLRRLGGALVTIVLIALVNFALFRMIPGDPVRSMLPRNVNQAQRDALRTRLGLDLPLLPALVRTPNGSLRFAPETLPGSLARNQLTAYVSNLLQWPPDLGDSFIERAPVLDVIGKRFWPTILLVGVAEGIALIVGLWIGIRAGWKRNSWFDTISVNTSLILYAVPLFWLGMLLLFFLGTNNGIALFPGQQMVTIGRVYSNGLELALDIGAHLVLPAATLALGVMAEYALIMRSSVVEVVSEDYVTTARAKGLPERLVLRRHVVPNALLPTVSLVALTFGYVLGGAIGVEEIFAWPGLGRLTIEAVDQRDFPVLQGLFLLITISVVLANLVAELIYGFLDPRVRA
ncbi:MAG: peptide/nickel transport system permease protein [Chloroflexota bacterium]|nr:peptide/nickel transport system permease protein [Chloroflexota bacterium]